MNIIIDPDVLFMLAIGATFALPILALGVLAEKFYFGPKSK